MKTASKALAVSAALVIAAAGTFGALRFASAQQGSSTGTATATSGVRQAYLQKVAANLGIPIDTLTTAMKDAGIATVEEQVANGRLTEAQGAKIKDAINSGKFPELAKAFRRNRERVEVAARRNILKSAAAAINVEPKDLVTELRSGKSIADVAGEHNVWVEDVKARIASDAKAKLDALVATGKLKQEREDAIMSKLEANLDKMPTMPAERAPHPRREPDRRVVAESRGRRRSVARFRYAGIYLSIGQR